MGFHSPLMMPAISWGKRSFGGGSLDSHDYNPSWDPTSPLTSPTPSAASVVASEAPSSAVSALVAGWAAMAAAAKTKRCSYGFSTGTGGNDATGARDPLGTHM